MNTQEQVNQNPEKSIYTLLDDFFDNYSVEEIEELLWEMYFGSVGWEGNEGMPVRDRVRIAELYNTLNRLLKDVNKIMHLNRPLDFKNSKN